MISDKTSIPEVGQYLFELTKLVLEKKAPKQDDMTIKKPLPIHVQNT